VTEDAVNQDDDAEMAAPTPLHVTPPSPKITRTSSDFRTWRTWAGTVSDLGKVAKRFEEIAGERGLSAETELSSGNQTARSTFEQIKEEIDPRTWTKIVLEAGGRYWSNEYLRLELRRRAEGLGHPVVELTVKSADPGATASAMSRLSEEIELSRPKWAWMHTARGAFVLTWMTTMALILPANLMLILASDQA
jgi:hypothetical protein